VKGTILINYEEREYGCNKWRAVAVVNGKTYYAEGATEDEAFLAIKEKIYAGDSESD
jgi:hypothetical protein